MSIVPVVRKAKLKDVNESLEDMMYWLSRPPQERIAAVTKIVRLCIEPGTRMDKVMWLKDNCTHDFRSVYLNLLLLAIVK
jgi:hypothetical protein